MQEEQKQKTNSGSTMQLNNCLDLADYKIENNGTFEELKQKLEKIFQEISVKEKYVRPTWDEYFMKITTVVAERATCLRHDIGAIIVKDKRIISTGYNGAAKGAEDCLKLGCRKDELSLASGMCSEDCRAIHAEQNAIIQAALHGVSTEGATLYCTTIPCRMCAKEIVNAGIKRVVTYSDYEGARGSIEYLRNLGVSFEKIARPNSTIKFKD
jgi:dCMP deaminase